MPSEKYSQKKIVRTREQIQQPFIKNGKHIIPIDLIVKRAVKPYTIYDHTVLDERSEIVRNFIKHGR